jgi:hypothetical protein
MILRKKTTAARHGVVEKLFHKLAKIFNGLHWSIGITTLPSTATSREERSFVLMWLGIIVFLIVFFAVLIYVLGTI